MVARFAKRFAYSILVILGITVITFMLIRLAGDPAVLLSSPDATPQEIEIFRVEHGFDRPLIIQYFDWLWHAVQGDLGVSYRNKRSALIVVLEALPMTLLLIGSGLSLAIVFGLLVGTL
ncbi:ABC transporter permease, partial [Mesorhizobium sp. M5C.F.Ca.IN.020.14.1.1]